MSASASIRQNDPPATSLRDGDASRFDQVTACSRMRGKRRLDAPALIE